MTAVRPDILEFFERYQSAGETPGSTVLTESFHEVFLSLDPAGVASVLREALVAALPRRKELFAAVGAGEPELTAISEIPLDELHTLVRTTWAVPVDGGEPLTLASDFLLRRVESSWQIVVYLNHQDVGELVGGPTR